MRFTRAKQLLLTLSFALSGTSQMATAQSTAPPPIETELAPAPIVVEDLGLSMRLPEGVRVTKKRQEAQRLIVESPSQLWIGTLEILKTSSEKETVKMVMDRLIEQTRQYDKAMHIKTREVLTIADRSIGFVVTKLLVQTRKEPLNETRIYAVCSPIPKTFAIYSVRGDGLRIDEIAALTRATVESFRFEDPSQRAEEVAQGLVATQTAFAALNESKVKEILEPDTWYRVYRRDDEGQATEIAYYRIQESTGPRAGASEQADRPNLTAAEAEQGLLVHQIARYVSPGDADTAGLVVEIQNIAWSSFDRQREQWSTAQVIYEPGKGGHFVVSRSTISGVREDGKIDVSIRMTDSNLPDPKFNEPVAYISQAEQHLLYRVLNPGQPGTYAMYQFRPQTFDIKRREEIITATNDPNRFDVRSTQDALQPPTMKTIDGRGRILRMITPDGQITQPSSPAEIQRWWKLAGLPTGAINVVPRPGSAIGRPGG